ncbi:non-ribosomal peptide synthetase [Micromonospora sp. CPCC 205561]|uniref:non-ribosomal peptide synthetase n=1 Tax=Micromonospora sp. CPCC 205561 TaxID=3122407 RepID=UPI002FF03931
MSVLRLFDDRCRAAPDAPAVEYHGETLTYAALDAAASRLARRLLRLGVTGRIVGVSVDRSVNLPVAVLAALRAGAAYLPLDPAYPPARLAFMLRDSDVRVLLTQPDIAERLPSRVGVRTVWLDEEPSDGAPPGQPWPAVTDEELAYVMYTSGSTGVPKGVAMPHGPLTNLIEWQRGASGCAEGARTLQFSAFSFDASFQEMFSTWAAGGCLVLVDEDVRRDPHRLLRFVDDNRINRIFMPFVALQALAGAAAGQQRFPQAVREVITAGEQLYVTPALRRFFAALPAATLVNQYGPSETHIVTSIQLGRDPGEWPELPSIGAAIDGAGIVVLDDRGLPLPVGATGEIAIGGRVLARGYLHRPALTAERFVPDPHGAASGRLYLTGDRGRLDVDGAVTFLGRDDGQVKIRGHRVELGEVEVAVKAVPGLADAVVVAHGRPGAERRLVAYAVAGPGGWPADVHGQLTSALPAHMVPVAVVPVDGFPTTPSGKVDRAALAAREVVLSGTGAATAEGSVEDAVRRLWEDVLDAVDVGPDDNFFQLGGTSLLAAVLTNRLNEEFGIQAELETFLRHPTVAKLSAWIGAQPVAPAAGGSDR